VMFAIALSVISTIIVNLNQRIIGTPREISGIKKKLFLTWMPYLLHMTPPKEIFEGIKSFSTKLQEREESSVTQKTLQETQEKLIHNQWKFVAIVVDRICLFVSM